MSYGSRVDGLRDCRFNLMKLIYRIDNGALICACGSILASIYFGMCNNSIIISSIKE